MKIREMHLLQVLWKHGKCQVSPTSPVISYQSLCYARQCSSAHAGWLCPHEGPEGWSKSPVKTGWETGCSVWTREGWSGLALQKGIVQKPHMKKKSTWLVITCHSESACFERVENPSELCNRNVLGVRIPRPFRANQISADRYHEI